GTFETAERLLEATQAKRHSSEDQEASAQVQAILRRLPQRQRLQQNRLGLRPLSTVGQYLGDVDACSGGNDATADLGGFLATLLIVGQGLVPATCPLADDAEARQHPCLPDHVSGPLIGLQRTLHERQPSLLTKRPIAPPH